MIEPQGTSAPLNDSPWTLNASNLGSSAASPASPVISTGRAIRGIMTFLFILYTTGGLLPAVSQAEQPTRTRTYGLLAGAPQSRIVSPGMLEIELETESPTPPILVYYGVNTMDEELDFPRFRKSQREPGEFTALKTGHKVRVDFRSLWRSISETPAESRICWRAEIYVPKLASSRFVEGRCYFDPETLGDTPNIVLGPFIEQVTKQSAIVTFETDRAVSGIVEVGDATVKGPESTRHMIPIRGLQSGRKYAYRVHAGRTITRPYAFRTASDGDFSFAAMVDSREGVGGGMRSAAGTNALALRELASHAYHHGASFILFAGDLINGYTTSETDFRHQLNAFRYALGPIHARMPIFESMGNHEALIDLLAGGGMRDKPGNSSAEVVFGQLFTNPQNGPQDEGPNTPPYRENVYTFDYGRARFIVLNNNYWFSRFPQRDGGNLEGFIMARQMAWLRDQVARADADPKVDVIFYAAQEPPFPNGGHTQDAMWYHGGDTNGDGEVNDKDLPIVENRNEMWEIIAGSRKSVAFITGDEHAYSRLLVTDATPVGHKRKPGGVTARFRWPVWQITTGGAGAPWYDRETNLPWSDEVAVHSTQTHYTMFHVSRGEVTVEVFSDTGQVIDEAKLWEPNDGIAGDH